MNPPKFKKGDRVYLDHPDKPQGTIISDCSSRWNGKACWKVQFDNSKVPGDYYEDTLILMVPKIRKFKAGDRVRTWTTNTAAKIISYRDEKTDNGGKGFVCRIERESDKQQWDHYEYDLTLIPFKREQDEMVMKYEFREGNRVRIKKTGGTGIVIHVGKEGAMTINLDVGISNVFHESEVELLTEETTMQATPAFKIGDRVTEEGNGDSGIVKAGPFKDKDGLNWVVLWCDDTLCFILEKTMILCSDLKRKQRQERMKSLAEELAKLEMEESSDATENQ